MQARKKIPRILLAKIGLDGHNRGVHVVADGLRRAGIEVIYTGLRQLPATVAKAALEEDVDFIGVSSMTGAHISIVRKLKAELMKQGASDIPILVGGIIPREDYTTLEDMGVDKVFPSGAEVRDIAEYIFQRVEEPCGSQK